MKITTLDAVESIIDSWDFPRIMPALRLRAERWRKPDPSKGEYKKVCEEYFRPFIVRRNKSGTYIHTGLIPRILDYAKLHDIPVTTDYPGPTEHPFWTESKVGVFEFRSYQTEIILNALKNKRGIIHSPTGSGKTVMQGGIIAAFPTNTKKLVLAHTISIVTQTVDVFRNKFGFLNVQQLGAGEKEDLWGDIVVSTRQTLPKIPDYDVYFDLVIVDEAHHVSKLNSEYGNILKSMMAPYRYGFTATVPNFKQEPERVFTMEALLGPTIAKISLEDAIEKEMISKPKVKIIKFDFQRTIHDMKNYRDVYRYGVVENSTKNRRIMREADKFIREGKRVLIVVVNVDHGHLLKEIGRDLFGMNCEFVFGDMESAERDRIKGQLDCGEIPCVITNVVWREGVDIPRLDVVINAGGGKSEIQTLQTIGRGLRKTEDKDETLIIDFYDSSHNFLIAHFGERLVIYCDNEWL